MYLQLTEASGPNTALNSNSYTESPSSAPATAESRSSAAARARSRYDGTSHSHDGHDMHGPGSSNTAYAGISDTLSYATKINRSVSSCTTSTREHPRTSTSTNTSNSNSISNSRSTKRQKLKSTPYTSVTNAFPAPTSTTPTPSTPPLPSSRPPSITATGTTISGTRKIRSDSSSSVATTTYTLLKHCHSSPTLQSLPYDLLPFHRCYPTSKTPQTQFPPPPAEIRSCTSSVHRQSSIKSLLTGMNRPVPAGPRELPPPPPRPAPDSPRKRPVPGLYTGPADLEHPRPAPLPPIHNEYVQRSYRSAPASIAPSAAVAFESSLSSGMGTMMAASIRRQQHAKPHGNGLGSPPKGSVVGPSAEGCGDNAASTASIQHYARKDPENPQAPESSAAVAATEASSAALDFMTAASLAASASAAAAARPAAGPVARGWKPRAEEEPSSTIHMFTYPLITIPTSSSTTSSIASYTSSHPSLKLSQSTPDPEAPGSPPFPPPPPPQHIPPPRSPLRPQLQPSSRPPSHSSSTSSSPTRVQQLRSRFDIPSSLPNLLPAGGSHAVDRELMNKPVFSSQWRAGSIVRIREAVETVHLSWKSCIWKVIGNEVDVLQEAVGVAVNSPVGRISISETCNSSNHSQSSGDGPGQGLHGVDARFQGNAPDTGVRPNSNTSMTPTVTAWSSLDLNAMSTPTPATSPSQPLHDMNALVAIYVNLDTSGLLAGIIDPMTYIPMIGQRLQLSPYTLLITSNRSKGAVANQSASQNINQWAQEETFHRQQRRKEAERICHAFPRVAENFLLAIVMFYIEHIFDEIVSYFEQRQKPDILSGGRMSAGGLSMGNFGGMDTDAESMASRRSSMVSISMRGAASAGGIDSPGKVAISRLAIQAAGGGKEEWRGKGRRYLNKTDLGEWEQAKQVLKKWAGTCGFLQAYDAGVPNTTTTTSSFVNCNPATVTDSNSGDDDLTEQDTDDSTSTIQEPACMELPPPPLSAAHGILPFWRNQILQSPTLPPGATLEECLTLLMGRLDEVQGAWFTMDNGYILQEQNEEDISHGDGASGHGAGAGEGMALVLGNGWGTGGGSGDGYGGYGGYSADASALYWARKGRTLGGLVVKGLKRLGGL